MNKTYYKKREHGKEWAEYWEVTGLMGESYQELMPGAPYITKEILTLGGHIKEKDFLRA